MNAADSLAVILLVGERFLRLLDLVSKWDPIGAPVQASDGDQEPWRVLDVTSNGAWIAPREPALVLNFESTSLVIQTTQSWCHAKCVWVPEHLVALAHKGS